MPHPVLVLEARAPPLQVVLDLALHAVAVVGVDAAEPFVDGRGHLRVVVAEHALPAWGEVGAAGPEVPVPQAVVGSPGGERVALLALPQRFFRLPALRDVLAGRDDAEGVAGGVADDVGHELNGERGPVLAEAHPLPLPHADVAEILGAQRRPVRRWREVARVHAQHLRDAVAVHGRLRGVGVEDVAVDVGDGDAELHRAHCLLEAHQRVRGALAVDGVAERAREERAVDGTLGQILLGPALEGGQADGVVVGADEDHDRRVTGGGAQRGQALEARLTRQVEVGENDVHIAAGEALASAREIGDGIDLPGRAASAAQARLDRTSVRGVSYDEEDTQAGAVGGDSAHIVTTILQSAYTANVARRGVTTLTGEGPHKRINGPWETSRAGRR